MTTAVLPKTEPRTGAPIALPRTSKIAGRLLGGTNTTIGVLATTAPLDSAGVNRLATLGHDGLALAIRPAHTAYDGDTLFALSLPGADAPPPGSCQLMRLRPNHIDPRQSRRGRRASSSSRPRP